MDIPIGPETPLVNNNDSASELRLGSALSNTSSNLRYRSELIRLHRARRAFCIVCAGHICLSILLLGIYLGVARTKHENYGDVFKDEFVHFHFNKSCIDIFWMSVIENFLYILIYIVLKSNALRYSLAMAFGCTIYLGIKVFAMPLNQGKESPVIYTMVVMTFIMSWMLVYLVDFQFKFTQTGTLVRFPSTSIPEDISWVGGDSPDRGNKSSSQGPANLNERRFSLGDSEFFTAGGEGESPGGNTYTSSTVSPNKMTPSTSLQRIPPTQNLEKTLGNLEEHRFRAIGCLNFAKSSLLPDSLEWKLEECGAFGTSVFSTESMIDSKKSKILKMEMVIPLSPQEADERLMEYTPGRSLWDESTDQFSLIENIDDSTALILLEIHNSEGVKKKEANDDVTSLVLTVEQDADGSIHRYGMSVESERRKSSGGGDNSAPSGDSSSGGKFLLYGYTLNTIATNQDKSELLFFMAIKRSGGLFGLSPGIKSLIQYLLLLSRSLLKIKERSRTTTMNSRRTLSLDETSDA